MKRAFRILIGMALFAVAARAGATDITFATDWRAQAEHGGFYQALAKGYYAEAGLNVTIRPGGPQMDIPRLMAAGAIQIGMASNSFQPIVMRGAGVPVTVIMTSFQKDPQVLMVHGDDPAEGMADLAGRPIFVADSALNTFWPWLKARFGFEDRQIRKYTYSLVPWLANKGSVQEGYLSSEPFAAQQAGANPKVFLFSDAGYAGYAAMVMARDDWLAANEGTVRAFVAATVRGWQDYIWGDPAPGNRLILKDNPEMTAELIAYGIHAMRDRDVLGAKTAVGHMDAGRWARFYRDMRALDAVPAGVDIQDVFTNAYLPPAGDGALP